MDLFTQRQANTYDRITSTPPSPGGPRPGPVSLGWEIRCRDSFTPAGWVQRGAGLVSVGPGADRYGAGVHLRRERQGLEFHGGRGRLVLHPYERDCLPAWRGWALGVDRVGAGQRRPGGDSGNPIGSGPSGGVLGRGDVSPTWGFAHAIVSDKDGPIHGDGVPSPESGLVVLTAAPSEGRKCRLLQVRDTDAAWLAMFLGATRDRYVSVRAYIML